MKKLLAIILSALMLFAFAACSKAPAPSAETPATDAPAADSEAPVAENAADASDADYIINKGEMNIGMTIFAPMNYYDNANNLVGFETEFATAVCEKIGVTPNFIEINWDSKEIELNALAIDCIWNGMTITEDRKANMEITDAYMKNRQVMVVKAENLAKYTESTIGASVVAEAGSAGEELAQNDEFFKDSAYSPADSMATALLDVKAGNADIAIVDYVTSIGSIGEDTDFADLVAVEAKEFAPEEYGIAFRKGSDMATVVNNTIDVLIADGTMDEIAAKYKLENLLIK